MTSTFNTFYFTIISKINTYSIDLLRLAIAIVYIWFGALKIVGISPAEELVTKTVFWFKPEIFVPILGICEVIIGLGLIIKRYIPIAISLLLLHMAVTFFPFIILKRTCFDSFPYCPTLVGQYIIKNLVIIAGAFVIAGKFDQKYYEEKGKKIL